MDVASAQLTISPAEPPESAYRRDRADRIARGILFVQQGLSYQEAGTRAGVAYGAIWRAIKRLDAEWEQRDENAWRRATSKAEVVTEMVLDRMMSEFDTCPPSVLPSWGMFAARLTGWENAKDNAGGSEGLLASILDKLGDGGGTVRVGIAVERPAPLVEAVKRPHIPQTAQEAPRSGVIEGEIAPIEDAQVAIAPTHDVSGE